MLKQNKLKNEGFNLETKTEYNGLKRSFASPPFSVLSSREGWWQKRKRLWLKLGIQSELGRGENESSAPGGSLMPAMDYSEKKGGDGRGRPIDKPLIFRGASSDKDFAGLEMQARGGGTSIFDPVLCELAYRWFCPEAGTIIDPFAGGSVRGIVSAFLGYKYWGCELRKEQVDANVKQGVEILQETCPIWHCGDSRTEVRRFAPEADFIFSCPPYGNLEVYSDDPNDISNKTYPEFLEIYSKIIKHSCRKLKQDRFACFVVSNYRDKEGFYHNFVGDTITIFEENGCRLYNDAILMTPTGSLPIRVTKQFQSGRKLGKTHQNVLIFYKGDPKNIKKNFGNLTNDE